MIQITLQLIKVLKNTLRSCVRTRNTNKMRNMENEPKVIAGESIMLKEDILSQGCLKIDLLQLYSSYLKNQRIQNHIENKNGKTIYLRKIRIKRQCLLLMQIFTTLT